MQALAQVSGLGANTPKAESGGEVDGGGEAKGGVLNQITRKGGEVIRTAYCLLSVCLLL